MFHQATFYFGRTVLPSYILCGGTIPNHHVSASSPPRQCSVKLCFILAELFCQATFNLAEPNHHVSANSPPPRQYSTKLRFILAELFRRATFYLAELCRQARFYLVELYRHIAFLSFFIYLLCNLIIITAM